VSCLRRISVVLGFTKLRKSVLDQETLVAGGRPKDGLGLVCSQSSWPFRCLTRWDIVSFYRHDL
jgi:hypothetical protein